MNKYALFLLLPIFLVFFVWGLQVANHLDANNPSDTTNQMFDLSKQLNPQPNGQKSLFIFIVSRLDNQTPELIGIWLMSYMSTEPYATVLAIYPSFIQNETTIDNRMLNSFRLKTIDGITLIDDEFLSNLKEKNIWSNGYVIIDFEGLAQVLSVSSEGGNPSIDLRWEDIIDQISNNNPPISSLITQTFLLQELCNQYTVVDSIAILKQLRDLYPYHISGNLDPDVLLGDWQQFIKSRNGSFCVFPQKEVLLQNTK